MAAALQEKEDLRIATELEQTESSVKLARSLSRPVMTEHNSIPFTRAASGSPGQAPTSAPDPAGPQISRSRTFGSKIESPVLKQRSYPLTSGKKSNSSLHIAIPESPARDTIRLGSVPPQGHPFLQTAADQQLFKEREETLVPVSKRADPPPYSPIISPPKRIESPSQLAPRSDPPTPEGDQSTVNSGEEETPVPPPPFSGVPSSKLRHNKRRK